MKLPVLGMAIVFLAGPAVAVADDLEDAVQSLKNAVTSKDVEAVKKLAATIRPMTAEIVASTAPQGADEKKDWAARVEYAKSTQLYVESAFYTVAFGVRAGGDGGSARHSGATESEKQIPESGLRGLFWWPLKRPERRRRSPPSPKRAC